MRILRFIRRGFIIRPFEITCIQKLQNRLKLVFSMQKDIVKQNGIVD